MLSKTRKNSPIRLAGGMVGVSVLTLAALGLTASGTQAAETITSRVETVTGITLTQDAPPPPETPREPRAIPTPGAAPVAPAAPPAPHRVVRVITSDREHDGHAESETRVVLDGTTVEVNGERVEIPSEAEIMAMVPDVRSGNCKAGDPEQMVVETRPRPGQRQRIVICVNRIQHQAADARRMAEGHRTMGMRSAVMGLRHARTAIEEDTTLSPAQKREALSGIDSAIRELEKNQKD